MKSLFNFYLEDEDKRAMQLKLSRLLGDATKGQIGAFLRIQIKLFLATPDNKVDQLLLDSIAAEYEICKIKNKRSNL